MTRRLLPATRQLMVLLAALALLASGCGGDDNAADTAADQAAADGDDGATTTTAPDGTESTTTTTEPVSGDSGSDWCGRIRTIAESDEPSPLDFGVLGRTPDELQAQFESNLEILEQWGEIAPPEIDADVDTVLDAYRTALELGNRAGWDVQVMAADPAFIEAFEDDALEAAGDRIDAYSSDVCGVDLAAAAAGASSAGAADGDIVSQLLSALGLPPNLIPNDGRDCINDALQTSGAFEEPIGPGYVPSAADLDVLSEAAAGCGIDVFG